MSFFILLPPVWNNIGFYTELSSFFLIYLIFFLDIRIRELYIQGMQMEELRTKLREFLNEKDLGLEKASVYFGLSTGFLSKFLNEKTNPNERNLHKIRKGLGLIKR